MATAPFASKSGFAMKQSVIVLKIKNLTILAHLSIAQAEVVSKVKGLKQSLLFTQVAVCVKPASHPTQSQFALNHSARCGNAPAQAKRYTIQVTCYDGIGHQTQEVTLEYLKFLLKLL